MTDFGQDNHELFQILSRVATLYYLEEKTQSEVAKELKLSRQKVQRLLRQARELGIVEIHVHSIPVLHVEQEARLKAIFNLEDVVVAPAHPDEYRSRLSVARAAANYLAGNLREGYVVAVGLGRNTSEVANALHLTNLVNCTFVSAMGGSPYIGEAINPNNITSLLASRAGGTAQPIYAPAYVESQRARNILLSEQAVRESLGMAKNADMAIVGIGTPDDDSILVRAGVISIAEVRRLRDANAVGELLGNYFDEQGQEVNSDLKSRLIALSLADLKHIPKVVGVASEKEKTLAIYSALRSGVLKGLITDCDNAVRILDLAGVHDLKEDATLLGITKA
jgi:DNA-binding transcriptional regulator LsrR (DeoR family)